VNGAKIIKGNARTIIRLIPFFDPFLKITPLGGIPRVVYPNRDLLVFVPGVLWRRIPKTHDAGTGLAIDRYFSPGSSNEQATEKNKTELNNALPVVVRHFDSY
jgi:hypothetical protein